MRVRQGTRERRSRRRPRPARPNCRRSRHSTRDRPRSNPCRHRMGGWSRGTCSWSCRSACRRPRSRAYRTGNPPGSFSARAVGGRRSRDLLHPARARRPLRPGRTRRSLRPLRDLPDPEIGRAQRPVFHLGRVDGVRLQLGRADAVARQRGGDRVGASAQRDRERETSDDQSLVTAAGAHHGTVFTSSRC